MLLARRRLLFAVLVGFLFFARNPSVLLGAQKSPCDPNLAQLGQNPQGYRLRGDRCEGVYIQPVSGSTTLLVASFTEFFEDFDPSSPDPLSVDWSSPASAETPVHLRAYTLREKLYYQMDATVAPRKTGFLWPAGVLNALHLSRQDIGVVGYTEYHVGGENRTLYVPLRIQQKKQNATHGYQLILLPGSELKEVFISLAQLGTDGQPHSFLINDHPLGKGYYPAERGILVEIPSLKTPGVYYLEIGATSRYGGPVTQRMWFYHAGNK
jgi:hypothetical protein